MKKIFTLLAVAAMAISAQAQTHTWQMTADFVGVDNKTYAEDTDCPFTLTPNQGDWNVLADQKFGENTNKYPEFTVGLQGSNNPSGDGKNYKKDDNCSFPDYGCAYIFSPKSDGVLKMYVKLADNKPTRVVTGTEYAAFECENVDSPIKTSAWEEGLTYACDGNGFCVVTVNTVANTQYCIVTNGSKVTLYGYDFEGSASLDSIVADENAPVEYFNLQGIRVANPENGLYIRRQGNKVAKVVL